MVYWQSFKLRQCFTEMPTQQDPKNNHTIRQWVEAIFDCCALTSSFPTGVSCIALAGSACTGYVTQHLLLLCCCHALVHSEEVHHGKHGYLGKGHTYMTVKKLTAPQYISTMSTVHYPTTSI